MKVDREVEKKMNMDKYLVVDKQMEVDVKLKMN
jgi:hypothetical protein